MKKDSNNKSPSHDQNDFPSKGKGTVDPKKLTDDLNKAADNLGKKRDGGNANKRAKDFQRRRGLSK